MGNNFVIYNCDKIVKNAANEKLLARFLFLDSVERFERLERAAVLNSGRVGSIEGMM
jgi:hypothetical protein